MTHKLYITKYALSEGVVARERLSTDSDGWARVSWPGGFNNEAWFRIGKDAHETKADAENAFENMRASAMRSAERKLLKLRAMRFEVKK